MIEIRDSVIKDVRELSKNLREKDRKESLRLGVEPHKALYYSYQQGVYRKTAFVNNEIAAMWGVAGIFLGQIGHPYLVTTPLVETISSLQFARIYRKEVEVMTKLFPILENYVDANYPEAIKMLKIAGFQIGPIELLGLYKTEFRKFSL